VVLPGKKGSIMTKVRVGVIGAGLLGLAHAISLVFLRNAGISDIDLVWVYDTDTRAAQSLVDNIGFEKVADNPGRIMDDKTIDTVFVATPTRFHKQYVLAAAEAGKNIFCEKPLFIDLDGARSMADAVKHAGVTGGVGLVLHYSPVCRFIRGLLAMADKGTPIVATIRDDQCLPIRGIHSSLWRADPSIAGGGTLIEHSIHDLNLFSWYFGRPVITDVSLKHHLKREGIEDYARVTMGFDDGMEATLISIWHDMVTRPSNRHIEVIYERLFIATDHDFIGPVEYTQADNPSVVVGADQVLEHFLEELGLTNPFFKALDYKTFGPYTVEDYFFIKAVAEKKEFSPGFDEAVAAHELVDDIYRRAKC
jgi:predicted dehydrogenase